MHHTAERYENAVREMDAILQLRHTGYKRLGFRKLCTFPGYFKINGALIDFDFMNLSVSPAAQEAETP